MIFFKRKNGQPPKDDLGRFKIKWGQAVLAFLTVLGIVGLGSWSVYSSQPHQVEKLSILSEANDAASLAYSQRESFNTAIAFEKWSNGDLSLRELQITRALLGQRLQVRLVSGEQTYDQLSSRYRWALSELDKIIVAGRNLTPDQRIAQYEASQGVLEAFLTETRRLSSELARLSLSQVNSVVQKRAQAEFWQAVITLFTALCGGIFFFWLLRDITNRFRESRKILKDERKKLTVVMNTLSLIRTLDTLQFDLLSKPVDSWKRGEFFDQLRAATSTLPTNTQLDLELIDNETKTVKVIALNPDAIDQYELDLIQERIQEIATIHASRRRIFEESNYRAAHDHITGLLNDTGLRHEIGRLTISKQKVVGIFLDIDRFHRINDAMGFQYGDSILRKVAEKISSHANPGDLVARISSDEFVLLTQFDDLEEARHKALEIQSDLEFVASHNNIDMEVTLSVGLVLVEAAELNGDSLLHDGAIVAHIAGRQARAGFAVYNEFEGKELVDALSEEFALKNAIKNNEFELYYQPVIRLDTNTIVGAESLVRWRRPGHGLIYPADFLPKLRDFNLMDDLGVWALQSALRMRKSAYVFQQQYGLAEFHVGINVEAGHLLRADFADIVIEALNDEALNPSDLVLEVTEHALSEGDVALENLFRLKEFGVWIAMDDFGTGYSNLSQVHRLPLTMLKLDKSFMPRENLTDIDKQLILDIQMIAKSLGIEALAEGVETQEVRDFISSIGLTFAQGYFYSPALPEIEFWNWVREFTQS